MSIHATSRPGSPVDVSIHEGPLGFHSCHRNTPCSLLRRSRLRLPSKENDGRKLEKRDQQMSTSSPSMPSMATSLENNEQIDDERDGDDFAAVRPFVLETRLAAKIRRLTVSRRRADYIEVLTTHAAELTQIPLSITCDVDTAQAFRDASREEIMLNGVCFVGDHRTEAFVAAVKRIVSRQVDEPDKYLAVTDRIMRGCSRTLSGSDSYFALFELFGCPEILIKPRETKLVPLDVTLGLDYADHRFKCRIKSTNFFGLYRNDDIDKLLLTPQESIEPFVPVDTLVVEIMDLTTDKTTRHLSIRTPPSPPTKLDLEIDELF